MALCVWPKSLKLTGCVKGWCCLGCMLKSGRVAQRISASAYSNSRFHCGRTRGKQSDEVMEVTISASPLDCEWMLDKSFILIYLTHLLRQPCKRSTVWSTPLTDGKLDNRKAKSHVQGHTQLQVVLGFEHRPWVLQWFTKYSFNVSLASFLHVLLSLTWWRSGIKIKFLLFSEVCFGLNFMVLLAKMLASKPYGPSLMPETHIKSQMQVCSSVVPAP